MTDRLPDKLESNARVEVRVGGVTVGTRRIVDIVAGDNVTISASDDGVNDVVTLTVTASAGADGGDATPTGAAGGALDGTYPNPGLATGVAGPGLLESSDVLSVNPGSGIEVTSDTVGLTDTGVVEGSYGTSVQIPRVTVDAKGRITDVVELAVPPSEGESLWVLSGGDLHPRDDPDSLTAAARTEVVLFVARGTGEGADDVDTYFTERAIRAEAYAIELMTPGVVWDHTGLGTDGDENIIIAADGSMDVAKLGSGWLSFSSTGGFLLLGDNSGGLPTAQMLVDSAGISSVDVTAGEQGSVGMVSSVGTHDYSKVQIVAEVDQSLSAEPNIATAYDEDLNLSFALPADGSGLILRSPDASLWKLTVSDIGVLTVVSA